MSSSPAAPPRSTKPKPTGWRRFFGWKRVLLALLGVVVAILLAGAVAYALIGIPSPNDLANAQASIVYYADGKTELDRISEINRESVPLKQVPLHVRRALLAAEDRDFYTNPGISPTGIIRAAWNTARGGTVQGGSTITQQYVKNYFLTQDQTLTRKLRELVISVKVDRQLSKDEVLANYLNTIYYGRGAYGIQTASRAYFDKDVSKLTVAEGALLAAVVRGPSLYDPSLGAEQRINAEQRVTYVLDAMRDQGWLTPQQRADAAFPTVVKTSTRKGASGSTGYITEAVRGELRSKLGLSDADIDRGGLRIVTTIQQQAQSAAVNAVKAGLPTGRGTENLHAGLVAVRPGDGAVVALYGGADYRKVQFSAATDARMQAGSTFKVFGLLAALQRGISTKTEFDGHSPQFFPEFADNEDPRGRVRNFGGENFGTIDLRQATAHSVNTVFAQLNLQVTPKATMDAAVLAGIPKDTPGLADNPANIFGSASPRVIDMANAYATIAAGGARATPYLVKKVTGADGNISFTAKPELVPAFDRAVTRDVTDAMEQVVRSGTGSGAQALGRPAAGKTGTTTNNLAVWFDGFTPQLAAAVGIYNDDNGTPKPMQNIAGFGEVTGGTFPVRIWTQFMQGALKGQKTLDFPGRAGVGDQNVTTTATVTTTTTVTPTTTSPPTRTQTPTTSRTATATRTTSRPTKTTKRP
ncbi:MAG TPA: transglycosylase domain-containing protein [Dermatophilaceae bacterium]|nr:transglycosylase domain-containing protein [Dermatophilaceae bacterium]